MLNDIVDGVVATLRDAFPGHEIYTEQVTQGLKPPCFSICPVELANVPFLGTRALWTALFNINYYPSGDEPKQECLGVGNALTLALEYITVGGDVVRGTNMTFRIVDGVLVFTLNYNVFVRRLIEASTMDNYIINEAVGGE